jgi:signal transduction histidine kinase
MTTRTRAPWIAWAIALILLAGTLTLSGLNGRFFEAGFPNLIYVAIVLGYSTVGALLASRDPGNRIGWLLLIAGLGLVLAGFGDEYVVYGLETRPGSLPGPTFGAMLSNLTWGPLLMAVVLVVLLFPTGRVPGPRWRFLPPTILGLFVLLGAGTLLDPGPLEAQVDVVIENPLGVEALDGPADLAETIGFLGLLPVLAASIVGLVLRYRRSRGEERQQIRWLVYVAEVVGILILVGIAEELLPGASILGDIVFFTTVAVIGIGVPAAIGVAILKYRLYDLDLVVKKTVLYGTVAVVLTVLFVAVALTIGAVANESQTGAVVAAAVIGLAFWPALRVSRRVADRVVYGRRATPYEVLTEFSHRVAGSYASEDVLPRMAAILAGAVGATRAVVWLRIGGELRPAGLAPADAEPPDAVPVAGDRLPALPADAAAEVRDQGDLLGALTASMPPNDPMNPSKDRLVHDLASQAGLVLRNVRLIEELRASRQRLVAAQDAERRKIERNIHDGAQQQLVALAVQLKLLRGIVDRDAVKAGELAERLQTAANDALEDLRDLARGIYPPLLADRGLAAALEAQARKAAVPTTVEAATIERFPADVEAAVYFCSLEALQNVAKYAEATRAWVRLSQEDGSLMFEVADDGRGFDPATAAYGSGLQGMADRLDALGGSLEVQSRPGSGTTVTGRIAVGGSS